MEKTLNFIKSSMWVMVISAFLLVLVNFIIYISANKNDRGFGELPTRIAENWIETHGLDTLKRVYPNKSITELEAMLADVSYDPFKYNPYTIFEPLPRITPYISVHENGFRLIGKEQASWPLNNSAPNIFVFGGSTTFGYGVLDNETIPARLQKHLSEKYGREINIYNFGSGAFILSQEMIRFQRLIVEGNIPDVVIFIDGLNDFWLWDDIPAWADFMEKRWDETAEGWGLPISYFLKNAIKRTPLYQFASTVNFRIGGNEKGMEEERKINENYVDCKKDQLRQIKSHVGKNDDAKKINKVIDRYLQKVSILSGISKEYDIRPVFVLQPIPTIEYDRCFSIFTGDLGDHYRSYFGYIEIGNRLDEILTHNKNIVSCISSQKGIQKNLYVDNVHYNVEGADIISECISNHLIRTDALKSTNKINS